MNQESPHIFFRSQPMNCPYLENESEYQLFTRINRPLNMEETMNFSNAGFRRSHNIMYRPVCPQCSACVSSRIRCNDFKLKPSWRRILNKNSDLTGKLLETNITYEQYELFHLYVSTRHHRGEMSNMSFQEYADMMLQSPIHTCLMEYRTEQKELIAACILDKFDDGYSAVYSFYNPFMTERSLGSYMILDLINYVNQHNLKYLYLGYWVKNSTKMNYKQRFHPLEGYINHQWQEIEP